MDFDDDDEDEWGAAELPEVSDTAIKSQTEKQDEQEGDGGDGYWVEEQRQKKEENDEREDSNTKKKNAATNQDGGEPMILVDMTVLSDSKIHCKFDPNAVNDPVAVKELRRKIEGSYGTYSTDAKMLAARTVIPCGSSVWKPALQALRREKPGHYFAPIFPIEKKS